MDDSFPQGGQTEVGLHPACEDECQWFCWVQGGLSFVNGQDIPPLPGSSKDGQHSKGFGMIPSLSQSYRRAVGIEDLVSRAEFESCFCPRGDLYIPQVLGVSPVRGSCPDFISLLGELKDVMIVVPVGRFHKPGSQLNPRRQWLFSRGLGQCPETPLVVTTQIYICRIKVLCVELPNKKVCAFVIALEVAWICSVSITCWQ